MVTMTPIELRSIRGLGLRYFAAKDVRLDLSHP